MEGVCGALRGAAGQTKALGLLRALSETPTYKKTLLSLCIVSGKSTVKLAKGFAAFLMRPALPEQQSPQQPKQTMVPSRTHTRLAR